MKNHSYNLHAPICGIFCLHSVDVARYAALIQAKSPTNCNAHLAESIFQTRSSKNSRYKSFLPDFTKNLGEGNIKISYFVILCCGILTIGTWDSFLPSSCFTGQNGAFSTTEQNHYLLIMDFPRASF